MRPTTDDRLLDRAAAQQKAEQLWPTLTKNQQSLIRFGMFPAEVMEAAEADGFSGRAGHDLVCALMDVAKANGGMRA